MNRHAFEIPNTSQYETSCFARPLLQSGLQWLGRIFLKDVSDAFNQILRSSRNISQTLNINNQKKKKSFCDTTDLFVFDPTNISLLLVQRLWTCRWPFPATVRSLPRGIVTAAKGDDVAGSGGPMSAAAEKFPQRQGRRDEL